MRLTLDASVFVSAYLACDVHHAIGMKLLGTLIENEIDLNAPVPAIIGDIELEHLHRYAIARDLAYGKDVWIFSKLFY